MKIRLVFAVLVVVALATAGCSSDSSEPDEVTSEFVAEEPIELVSTTATTETVTTSTASVPSTTLPPSTTTTAFLVSAESGKALYKPLCSNCHTLTETPGTKAPTHQGLFGSTVELADGSSVLADSAYIRESIVDPQAKIVKGDWTQTMPTYSETYEFGSGVGARLSADQIDALVLFVESLG
jgi:cytochrome c5